MDWSAWISLYTAFSAYSYNFCLDYLLDSGFGILGPLWVSAFSGGTCVEVLGLFHSGSFSTWASGSLPFWVGPADFLPACLVESALPACTVLLLLPLPAWRWIMEGSACLRATAWNRHLPALPAAAIPATYLPAWVDFLGSLGGCHAC